jgi:hypothetical protein
MKTFWKKIFKNWIKQFKAVLSATLLKLRTKNLWSWKDRAVLTEKFFRQNKVRL